MEYPVTMVHPQHKAARVSNFDSASELPGDPERFPPVEVFDADQEALMRARGYLRYGEDVPKVTDYNEYPKFMRHPEHVDAVPPTTGARAENGGIVTYAIPGVPEKFPDVMVRNAEEQEEWGAKGYKEGGHSDERAFEKAKVAPGVPGDEWPKWEDGKLVPDPNAPVDLSREYPKWLHFDDGRDVLVNSPAEEAKAKSSGYVAPKAEPAPKPYVPMPAPQLDADELAAFRAWKEAQAGPAKAAASPLVSLRAELDAKGTPYDKRWGEKRLREALEAA